MNSHDLLWSWGSPLFGIYVFFTPFTYQFATLGILICFEEVWRRRQRGKQEWRKWHLSLFDVLRWFACFASVWRFDRLSDWFRLNVCAKKKYASWRQRKNSVTFSCLPSLCKSSCSQHNYAKYPFKNWQPTVERRLFPPSSCVSIKVYASESPSPLRFAVFFFVFLHHHLSLQWLLHGPAWPSFLQSANNGKVRTS